MTDLNDESPLEKPDDVDVDTAAPGGPEEAQEAVQEELDPLERLEAEVARWRDLAMRSQADLDNYRKRMAREKTDAVRYANTALLETLLPILDSFSRGLEAARGEESSNIYQGMSMVLKQIEDFLKEHGVEAIPTRDTPFDPNLHEAIREDHSDEVPEGHIISEVRKGYRLKDRLLRASNIIVSKGPAGSAADPKARPQEKSNT